MTITIAAERRAAYVEAPGREVRFREAEIRSNESDGTLTFEGYASVTDTPYTVTDWLGDYTETIARGAFTKSLKERDDVRLLVNHEGVPLARTKSGTLDLSEDDIGLRCVANLDPESPLVQTLVSAMKRGDLDQMSFAFKATRQEWNEDYTERTIREVKLYDVSGVTYPASPTTSAKLRSGLVVPADVAAERQAEADADGESPYDPQQHSRLKLYIPKG